MPTGTIFLKRGKEKPLHNRHPWVFSGAIARVENASDGDTVDVYDAGGTWLARAAFNSRSQITARVWTFERDEQIDRPFFERRLSAASLSSPLRVEKPSAYRLVSAESDFLPGIVVDRYADFLVVQFLTLGAETHKQEFVQLLAEQFRPRGIYERSDVDVRKREGLPELTGVLFGEEPPDRVQIQEHQYAFRVDVKRGHKTGFYLDQRVNRLRAAPYLTGDTLNCFAYTGAFGVYAAEHARHIINLDSSVSALDLAHENMQLNATPSLNTVKVEYVTADAFEQLRAYRAAGVQFDAIVLDPPKFATSQGNVERAARGYKDLNMLAFQLLRPNGTLVTFSCSGLVDSKLFQQIVFSAAVDARRDAQILERLGQAPDHPIGLNVPESEYLKGMILRVI